MAIAALFSTASAINATLYGGSNVSYMIAKRGELPEIFERKAWSGSNEGLFITAGLVLVLAILFDLGGIAMLGSASFLLIYSAVNVAHLRLRKETGANVYIIWASIIGCLSAFTILIYYELNHSPMTLVALVIVLILSFFSEWIYRRYSQRTLRVRFQGK
jgi:L-asparagine transporter-like permease